jgi:hypothetical protein
MRSRGALLRAGALISAAALALHQLRYAIGYGLGSHDAVEGHAYLPLAFAIATGLLLLATVHFLALSTRSQRPSGGTPRFRVTWLAAAAVLLAIFVGQELLEGLLAGGQGVDGLLAHAGWSAILLAVGLGALVALALRGADRVLAGTPEPGRPWSRVAGDSHPLDRRELAPPGSVLSRHLASRAPPLTS